MNTNCIKQDVYPIVIKMDENDIIACLEWLRIHDCIYSRCNTARHILNGYTNNEIITNGLLSELLEQYGSNGSLTGTNISLVLSPSIYGTSYKIFCRCGCAFIPQSQTKKLLD